MAIAADVNGGLHLLTRITFLEPAISVAPPRNQVVLGGTFFKRSGAQLTGLV